MVVLRASSALRRHQLIISLSAPRASIEMHSSGSSCRNLETVSTYLCYQKLRRIGFSSVWPHRTPSSSGLQDYFVFQLFHFLINRLCVSMCGPTKVSSIVSLFKVQIYSEVNMNYNNVLCRCILLLNYFSFTYFIFMNCQVIFILFCSDSVYVYRKCLKDFITEGVKPALMISCKSRRE